MNTATASAWEKDYHDAVNVLLSFDLVLVTEWLHEPGLCSWFKAVLGIDTFDFKAFNMQHMKGTYDTTDYDGVLLKEDIELLFEVSVCECVWECVTLRTSG